MTHFKFVSIMKAENTVSSWAKSTEDKITDYFDEYLINFPQSNVRKSSKKLLYSLFRKGTSSIIHRKLNSKIKDILTNPSKAVTIDFNGPLQRVVS